MQITTKFFIVSAIAAATLPLAGASCGNEATLPVVCTADDAATVCGDDQVCEIATGDTEGECVDKVAKPSSPTSLALAT